MVETGLALKSSREKMGLSLEEVSRDLEISVIILEQIEAGAIGAFSNIYELKDMIIEYARYLGLDTDEVVYKFSEYMFDQTSKIPMAEIEKRIQEQKSLEDDEDRIKSPYTKIVSKEHNMPYIITGIIIILLVIATIVWSISKIGIN